MKNSIHSSIALIAALFCIPAQADEQGRVMQLQNASDTDAGVQSSAPVPQTIVSPLPADAEELAAGKAAAEAEAGTAAMEIVPLAPPPGPKVVKSFAGQKDPTGSPPDTTSAVGTTRYIEPLNRVFKIWDKSGSVKGSGTLQALFGVPSDINVFDPQVIWDPSTNRFYLTGDVVVSDTDNRLFFGFSKTASPNKADDFCKYFLGYGAEFPDFPKLGDTNKAVLIGANVFGPSSFLRSDLVSISKPPAGKSCPDASTFKVAVFGPLKTSSGALAFTPVPANQIDGASTGWIVGRPASVPAAGANQLVLWKVNTTTSGTTTIANKNGKKIAVKAYKIPANAKQPNTTHLIDTSDTRPTQAVSAVNPNRSNKVSLWTQHTVFGGAGAEVRWYEINPAGNALFASGKLSSTARYYFNAAISPDRAVKGSTKKFGNTMGLQVSGSSSSLFPSIYAVSKRGSNAQSALTTVRKGTQKMDDFTCSPVCRWGDYAGLTPDPTPPAGAAHGRLWGNNELGAGTTWTTRNFAIDP
ncbi:MAG: hypothetical protein ACU837_00960 [Gammaproteobacteria bacterium]